MSKVNSAFILYLFFSICSAFGQTGSVSGRLVSKGESLPGAVVIIEATKLGTTTAFDGTFQLFNIPIGKQIIKVSYLGFKPLQKEVVITAGTTTQLHDIELEPDAKTLKEVSVTGSYKIGSEDKAINMVKTSSHVVSVMSSEAIAKLPSKTAAEAVKRIAGTSVQNDKGEGSLVSLRGTPIDWTATLVNGDRLPTSDEENASRAFDFEVLPSDFIDYIVVARTVTPDQESDNIGGIINFLTRSNVEKKTFKVNIGGGYNTLAGKPLMNAAVTYGNVSKNKKFSYVLDGSYYGRYYGAQAYKVVYASNFNQGIASYELKDYSGMRNTIGANAAFEYKPNDNVTVGGRFFYGRLSDDKNQYKTRFNYSDGSGARLRLQSISGMLIRQLFGGDVHGEFKVNDKITITAKVATYHNSFRYGNRPFKNKDPRNGYFFTEFMSPLLYYKDVDSVEFNGDPVGPNTVAPIVTKLLGVDNPYGTGDNYNNIQPQPINPQSTDPLQAGDFEFYRSWSELNDTWERDPVVARVDLNYVINNDVKLQFGFKGRYKEGARLVSLYEWRQNVPLRPQPYLLTDFNTVQLDERGGFLRELGSPYAGTFFPFLPQDQLLNFVPNLGDTLKPYEMNPVNTEYRFWAGNRYTYTEGVYAGYGMADVRIGKVQLVAGARLEYTNLQELSDTLLDSLAFDQPTGNYYYVPEQRRTSLKYLSVLPSINATWTINDKMNLRSAFSRTMHRPNFAETKPGSGAYCIDDLDLTYGNSRLKPAYSYNFDLTYEYFWGNKGMFSVGGYYKYVVNHIFAITTSYVDEIGIVAKRYDNANQSFVYGFEGAFVRKFTGLPGILSGFGLNANLTYSLSRMQAPGRSNKQAMTEQTPFLYNVALFYENDHLQARIAFNYTGAYLKDLNLATVKDLNGNLIYIHNNSDFDIFKGPMYSLDFGGSYTFKKHYTVYVELMNLLDWPDLTYRGQKERPIRTEYYRQRGQIGFKYDF